MYTNMNSVAKHAQETTGAKHAQETTSAEQQTTSVSVSQMNSRYSWYLSDDECI